VNINSYMSNVTSLLEKIKSANDKNTLKCYVPSINAQVESKQLSVKQQKDIIRSAMDGSASGVTFSIAINNIIQSNIVNSNSLSVADRPSILIAIRAKALGTSAKSTEGVILDFTENLTKTIENYPNIDNINYEGISVNVNIPTIARDQEVNLAILPNLKEYSKQNEVGETISNIWVYEIAKFITMISFDDLHIDTNTISIKDLIKVVESFPTNLNNLIIDYIKTCRIIEDVYLTVGSEKIAMDASFFTQD